VRQSAGIFTLDELFANTHHGVPKTDWANFFQVLSVITRISYGTTSLDVSSLTTNDIFYTALGFLNGTSLLATPNT